MRVFSVVVAVVVALMVAAVEAHAVPSSDHELLNQPDTIQNNQSYNQLNVSGSSYEHLGSLETLPPATPDVETTNGAHLAMSQLVEEVRTLAASMERMAEMLSEVHDALITNNPDRYHLKIDIACAPPYTPVGTNCLLLGRAKKLKWHAARQYCWNLGGDLASFSDQVTFFKYMSFVIANELHPRAPVWVGASDEAEEDTWIWTSGEMVPRGPPLWGTTYEEREPTGGVLENCGAMSDEQLYTLHDYPCSYEASPLCQKT